MSPLEKKNMKICRTWTRVFCKKRCSVPLRKSFTFSSELFDKDSEYSCVTQLVKNQVYKKKHALSQVMDEIRWVN